MDAIYKIKVTYKIFLAVLLFHILIVFLFFSVTYGPRFTLNTTQQMEKPKNNRVQIASKPLRPKPTLIQPLQAKPEVVPKSILTIPEPELTQTMQGTPEQEAASKKNKSKHQQQDSDKLQKKDTVAPESVLSGQTVAQGEQIPHRALENIPDSTPKKDIREIPISYDTQSLALLQGKSGANTYTVPRKKKRKLRRQFNAELQAQAAEFIRDFKNVHNTQYTQATEQQEQGANLAYQAEAAGISPEHMAQVQNQLESMRYINYDHGAIKILKRAFSIKRVIVTVPETIFKRITVTITVNAQGKSLKASIDPSLDDVLDKAIIQVIKEQHFNPIPKQHHSAEHTFQFQAWADLHQGVGHITFQSEK